MPIYKCWGCQEEKQVRIFLVWLEISSPKFFLNETFCLCTVNHVRLATCNQCNDFDTQTCLKFPLKDRQPTLTQEWLHSLFVFIPFSSLNTILLASHAALWYPRVTIASMNNGPIPVSTLIDSKDFEASFW